MSGMPQQPLAGPRGEANHDQHVDDRQGRTNSISSSRRLAFDDPRPDQRRRDVTPKTRQLIALPRTQSMSPIRLKLPR